MAGKTADFEEEDIWGMVWSSAIDRILEQDAYLNGIVASRSQASSYLHCGGPPRSTAKLMAMPHDRCATTIVQPIQHRSETPALRLRLVKHLELRAAALNA